MTSYEEKRALCLKEAGLHSRRADNYRLFNGISIVATALLAATAAVTSATSVPTWVTTAAAGLSAALATIIAGFKPQQESDTNREVAADLERLASRYEQADDLQKLQPGEPLSGEWVDKLGEIQNKLNEDKPCDDEAGWAAARVPAHIIPTPAPSPVIN